MKGMDYFFKFRRSYEGSIAESESLKKKIEDSKTDLARLQELYTQREKELAESKSAAQARISDLEFKLVAANVIIESMIKYHSALQAKFTSAKVEVDLQIRTLNIWLWDATNEIVAHYERAEALSKSIFDLKAKKQLCKYKEKAWSFYR
jgi:hypothetical protein